MKTLITLITLALITTASARIGETAAQCQKRYGKPTSVDKEKSSAVFKKAGLLLHITFWKNKAHSMTIRTAETDILDNGKEISDVKIQMILKANRPTKKGSDKKINWKKSNIISMDKNWQTEGEELYAQYTTIDNLFMIVTKEFIDHMAAKKAAKEKESLQDF